MVPRLKDFLDLLEKIAPAALAEPWDNPGLQVGSYFQEIRKVFFALDPTLNALKAALRSNAQVLFTHHPLVIRPLSQLDINIYPGNVIFEAIKSNISVVSAHTNLDVARGGINDILADLFNLKRVEVLKEIDGVEGVGLGRIGDLPGSTKLSVVAKNVEKTLGAKGLRVIGQGDVMIHRLAVVGGSGGGLISLVSQKGGDVLLTGDVNYHHAREAESLGISLIDGGHFHTEKAAFRVFAGRLKDVIADQGWEFIVEVDESETDPLHGD